MSQKEYILFKSVNEIERADFYDHLAIMIDGGVSISSALEGFRTKNAYFIQKIEEIKNFIAEGDSLSKAMKKNPDIFKDSETAIIEAGENSGSIQESMSTLAETLKHKYNLRKKIKGSLTYPLIIIIFLILSVIITMVHVIPQLMPLFADADTELPFATVALIATSDFFSNNLLLIFTVIFGAILFVAGYKKTENGKTFFDSFLLGMPLIGDIYRNYLLANIASNLGTLIGGGIPISKTLKLTGRATDNIIYEAAFEDINDRIMSGKKIADSMMEVSGEYMLFPTNFVQMVAVGEKTASIDKIAVKVNNQYTKEVNSSLDSLTKWIEPMAILFAGVFVLWFAFAIFGAILKVTETIG